MKRFEFAKIFSVVIVLMFVSVAVFTCVMVWRTGVVDPLNWLITAIGAALATVIGFYFWKSRAENKIKLKAQYKIQLNDSDFD